MEVAGCIDDNGHPNAVVKIIFNLFLVNICSPCPRLHRYATVGHEGRPKIGWPRDGLADAVGRAHREESAQHLTTNSLGSRRGSFPRGLPAFLTNPLAGFLREEFDSGLRPNLLVEVGVEGLGLGSVFFNLLGRAVEDDAFAVALKNHRDFGILFGGGHFGFGFHIGFLGLGRSLLRYDYSVNPYPNCKSFFKKSFVRGYKVFTKNACKKLAGLQTCEVVPTPSVG